MPVDAGGIRGRFTYISSTGTQRHLTRCADQKSKRACADLEPSRSLIFVIFLAVRGAHVLGRNRLRECTSGNKHEATS